MRTTDKSGTQREFGVLMHRVREQSRDAVQELLEHYGPHILRVIRRKLNKRMRSKFDSADFAQAVWASFFAGRARRYAFDRPEALLTFLTSLARNKVVEAVRQRCQTQKYNVHRELPFASSVLCRKAAVQPTPSQAAVVNEEWEKLLGQLPPHRRRILVLLRQGSSCAEIAQELGLSVKTIRRIIQRLAQRNGAQCPF